MKIISLQKESDKRSIEKWHDLQYVDGSYVFEKEHLEIENRKKESGKKQTESEIDDNKPTG